jgi:small-conductance mechanosensitive channel
VLPVLATVIWVAYLLFAARMLFKDSPGQIPFVVAAILGGVAIASWSAIRDALSGVFVKAGRVCRVGDHVSVEGVKGRIVRMGLRAMTVETNEGDEAIIPYGQVSRSAMLRTPVIDAGALHVFRISTPRELSSPEAKKRLREAILRCHWSSLVREPQVVPGGEDVFEVTVFALDPDRGPDIEAEVRRAFGQ